MKHLSRRGFMKGMAGAAAAWSLTPTMNVLGANDDIRVAVVGFRGMGKGHIKNFLKMPGVRLVALCDADRAILDAQVAELDKQGVKVKAYQDIRKMLEDKAIDAFSTATPNHWHSLATVWGCQAGKDVDVEKPVSHNIWEGRKMVEAARKYNRIVQADLDSRSDRANDEACEYIHSGALGKILVARGFCYKDRPSLGQVQGAGQIPESVDYNLWCGPASNGPLRRKNLHYDWHWVWETGCGELGNNGPHQLDLIRWMLKEPGLPRRVMSLGGRFGYEDDGETPNTQIAFYDYATAPVIYEVRGLRVKPESPTMDVYEALAATGVKIKGHQKPSGAYCGVIIQCEGGYVDLSGRTAFDNEGKEIKKFARPGSIDPQANFIKAVRSRKLADIKTDILEGHLSTSLCHMGNISYRVGAGARPEAIRERLQDDKDGQEAFGRFTEHLRLHEVELSKKLATLGPWLTMDSAQERFTGPLADQANTLIKRQYREPFVIREQV